MPLVFEAPARPAAAAPLRTDVTAFIGHVAQHAGMPLLQQAVTLDSWADFDRLFDWRSRPITAGGGDGGDGAVCASTLGAAVRSYFAGGGRRAVVVRCGDPWPVLAPAPTPAQQAARRAAVLPDAAGFSPFDPSSWRGLFLLAGLAEVAQVCLPDLPELWALPPAAPATVRPAVPPPEVFVACSTGEAPPAPDLGLQRIAAPRLDAAGWAGWATAVGQVRDFLARHRRDCLFVGALPLADGPAADPLALRAAVEGGSGSAFVQLAAPWLRTRTSDDLPQQLAPPDGVLAGLLAAHALARGCFRSAAGTPLRDIVDAQPLPAWSLSPDAPWPRLAERVCLFAPEPGGWALQSDVTTAADPGWHGGQASRLMASVLRAARGIGEPAVFDVNGPALWTRLRRQMEALLLDYWQAGGLGGASPGEAFEVRCDGSTMTQNDLDAGRVVARVTLLPVAAVERISVALVLATAERSAAVPLAETA